ncbi:DNA polymerase III subunit delta [Thalassobius sp. Cn5-15]|uniref:DNA polymerase III subunit delta n=1 Tax=Thalassobius sp. Cn5-15 TaxID=2917763 RepID=UPI001EF19158|nr:DNA polymerase III subunit delta [Thalassobius sp. Cn5-15]MCG7494076.1 DNA polymerase III subunit delta [Thalassobius sp. Cn5-15]
MKLSPRDANKYFRKPEADRAGLLIYSADAMRAALKRQEVIAALIGPNGEEEMRLTRMSGASLRKDPAQLLDAIKAVSFFPGPRVVFVEDANDSATPAITNAMVDWAAGDAQVIVTGGALKPTSKLRKLFEAHPNAYAVGLYDDPPSREDIEAELARSGVKNVDTAAMTDLMDLGKDLSPGDFRQTMEKLALYKLNDATPVTPEDVTACAPATIEAALDDILNVVAEGRSDQIGPILEKLKAQGVNAVSLCIGTTRHFRTLFNIAANDGGRIFIPGSFKQKERSQKQARTWGPVKLQAALTLLLDTDLQLRSAGQNAPAMALVERSLIRLAMMARR